MSKIKNVRAREILASGGDPTVEAIIELESGITATASVPYGASAGSHEAVVLTDGDEKRYGGKGMLKAVANIENEIGPMVMGMEVTELKEIDKKMIELDGTENKARLGGNAILAVSLAVARAGAREKAIPLYKYLREIYEIEGEYKMPRPMVVMIEGGKHADNSTDLQEYLVSMLKNDSARENVRREMEIYAALKKIFKELKINTNVGNEGALAYAGVKQPDVTITGAFAPVAMKSNEEPLGLLLEAIKKAGYEPGVEAGISLDAAASEFFNSSIANYELKAEKRTLTAEELIEYYLSWMDKYPIVTMEDMLDEDDWDNWVKLTAKINGRVPNIADDLTVTNTKRWQRAIETKAATAILIKLNQAGTVSETMECCKLARKHGLMTVPSHRGGGETNDTFMVDLAVAVGSEYIKVGPTRGERVCKYNRLMEIEDQLNN